MANVNDIIFRHKTDPNRAFPANLTAGRLVAEVAERAPKHQFTTSSNDN